jgi:molybdopterin-containing oxidoreductase family molybdopterin binding subunit
MKAQRAKTKEIYEDVWIPTQCRRCQSECAIRARRVNGVVVKLEGNPNSYVGSRGGLCPKGLSGLQVLYDPNRLNVPLRRTNPEKGMDVDPKWKEISWAEALDEISEKLKKAMDNDPSKILIQHGISASTMLGFTVGLLLAGLSTSKGAPEIAISGGANCGNAGHFTNAQFYGAFCLFPDWKHCNYTIVFGTNTAYGGFMQYVNRLAAEALDRGMKLVVFDPVCNNAAAKATEWIPIIPGTDGAVVLAMLNVIVNELGIYDAVYLKKKSNAPYLIGPDGRYVRNEETKKPMVWDTTASRAKVFDDSSIGDFDLDGTHEVNNIKCRPAWQLLKETFKKYTPESASEVSGVPAATIRRIATEFAEAAMVGATVTVDGKQFPLRPVGTQHIRAAVTHHNAMHTVFAIELLPHVLGAANVPGGNLSVSVECHGYSGTGLPFMGVKPDPDGLLDVAGKWLLPRTWPLPDPVKPHKDLLPMFPMALEVPLLGISDREKLLRGAHIDPDFEIVVNIASNSVLNAPTKAKTELFKKVPFIVDIDIFPTEFNEGFADIVLPDTSYLEYSDWAGIFGQFHSQPHIFEEPWCFHITQKVVEPQYSRRHSAQVVIDLLDRMDLRAKVNAIYNDMLYLDETRQFKPTEKIDWDDLCDRVVTQHFGPEHNWEWFKKHGFISWPKKVEETYWKYVRDVRVPVYWEWMIDLGEKTKKIADEMGIELPWERFTPVPQWYPIPPHLVEDPQYDLYCFCYRDPLHVGSASMEQPWIDEASRMNPYTYNITMNDNMAKQKGLKDGDTIELESDRGTIVQGVLKLRKGQHPNMVTIMGTAGHWAKGQPIARGKGVNFMGLLENRWSDLDPISMSLEACVKVTVKKVSEPLQDS